MIQAVYFDLDNTLVDRVASIDRFSEVFIDIFGSYLPKVMPEQIATFIQRIDHGGYLTKNTRYTKIAHAIGAELERCFAWTDVIGAETLTQFWRREFPSYTVEINGARELILKLSERGYFIGIISNGAELSRQRTIQATSFAPYIRQIVSSGGFGVSKPHPSIFIETAKASGFRPDQCAYVGDHPINDAQGALSAGMLAIRIMGFHRETVTPVGAYEVNQLDQVFEQIQNIDY